jgi:Recombination endonuclease VII
MSTPHDTELCAEESGCDEPVNAQDLCRRHARNARFSGTAAPKFRRLRSIHALAESNGDHRWCIGCQGWIRPSKRGTCLQGESEFSRYIKTGWTAEEFDLALIAQGNRCALCGRKPGKMGLHADHCHITRSTRQLLDADCNTALGLFRDNPELMQRAADYVKADYPKD